MRDAPRDTSCVVCGRREPARGRVCESDRKRLTEQLAALPGQMARIDRSLIPIAGGGLDDERVHITRVDAPIPVRVDALSLAGPGSEDVEWMPAAAVMQPAVRRWATRSTVTIERTVNGQVVQEERTIVEWHVAGSGELVGNDDQGGVVPPREWLDVWARRFRRFFGHHVPRRTYPRRPEAQAPLEAEERRRRARTVLGIGGYVEPVARPDDPLAEEWDIRFGERRTDHATDGNVRYLLTFLDAACDRHPDVDMLAAELRSLSAELGRVLGERRDQQWLGRCPAMIVRRDGEEVRRPCGAGLWQNPHASRVCCPRCQSTWGPGALELLRLAGEIRQVWPLDRRRRYGVPERDGVPEQKCAGCGKPLEVRWQEVTAPTDREQWWKYVGVSCSSRCPDAGKGV